MTAQQKSFKVLVIGDACIDQYFMCIIDRLNPESSAPLVRIGSTYIKEGMAGNVALCLRNLGLKVELLLSTEVEGCSPATKTRYINAKTKEQLLRVDFDPKVQRLTSEALYEKLKYPHNYSAVVISDYDKGFLDIDVINEVARLYSGPIYLDTKKKDLHKIYGGITIKINEHEANAATIVPYGTIVTMGASGVIKDNERWPAFKSESVDVCGAGDAFLAGLVFGKLYHPSHYMDYAIVNAGLSVRHVGTYSPTFKELEEGLNDYYKQCRKN